MSNQATFIKYLFSTSLNGLSVAKYEPPKNYEIMLKVESSNTDQLLGYDTKLFRTEEDYEKWIDRIVDDETAIYNKARALYLVLQAMRSEASAYPFEDTGVYGE